MVTQIATFRPEGTIYRDALSDCRQMGNAQLLAFIDTQRYEAEDIDNLYDGDETARVLADERLRAGRDEFARRQQLHAKGRDVADPQAPDYAAWRDLAERVKGLADIVRIFYLGGYYPRARRDQRTARRRGVVRHLLGVWRHRPAAGVAWSQRTLLVPPMRPAGRRDRRGANPDPRGPGWHDAVAFLARDVGLTSPDEVRLLAAGWRRQRRSATTLVPTRVRRAG